MKVVCFIIYLIFLLQCVENKVKYSDDRLATRRKCHGIQKRDCAQKCGSISNIESCIVTDDNYECVCKW